ncbi:hypothetical protein CBM2633_B10539 [Cupriavidus taiwanensis]|nr:hypothetical protein CBM2633_B10539 [Cupriavidus taiwanensis]
MGHPDRRGADDRPAYPGDHRDARAMTAEPAQPWNDTVRWAPRQMNLQGTRYDTREQTADSRQYQGTRLRHCERAFHCLRLRPGLP